MKQINEIDFSYISAGSNLGNAYFNQHKEAAKDGVVFSGIMTSLSMALLAGAFTDVKTPIQFIAHKGLLCTTGTLALSYFSYGYWTSSEWNI